MQDRFRAKTWIYQAQLIGCGSFGAFGVIFGVLFWTGTMKDALDKPRPEAGPPMVIVGSCLLAVATLALSAIIARMTPLIRCYREGIECNLVGVTSLDNVPLVPGLVHVAWSILSLQGFRSHRVRLPWSQFVGANVRGIPMAYALTLSGAVFNLKTGRKTGSVFFCASRSRRSSSANRGSPQSPRGQSSAAPQASTLAGVNYRLFKSRGTSGMTRIQSRAGQGSATDPHPSTPCRSLNYPCSIRV